MRRFVRESGCDATVYASQFSNELPELRVRRVLRIGLWRLDFHPGVSVDLVRNKYDVLVTEGSIRLLTSVIAALSPFGPRVVWWTSMWRRNGPVGAGGPVRRLLLKRVLGRVAAVVTYGSRAAEAVRRLGVPEEKVFIAYNAIDTWQLREAECLWKEGDRLPRFQRERGLAGRSVVLFVGRLIKEKRVRELILAIGILATRMGVRAPILLIVGVGPHYRELKCLVEAEGLSECVWFVGEIRDDVALCPYLLSARVLVLPGTGGLAVNQALTLGVPAIVGGGDGTEEDLVVDGENGRLLSNPSAATLAETIQDILESPCERIDRLSRLARQRIDDVANVSAMISGLVAAVRHALGDQLNRRGGD